MRKYKALVYCGDKPIKKIPKKYRDRLFALDHDEDGWWIYLQPGWKSPIDPTGSLHTIHEDTKKEVIDQLRTAMPCNCEDCKKFEIKE